VLLSFPFRLGPRRWERLDPTRFTESPLSDVPDPAGWPNDAALTDACRTARQLWAQCLDERQTHVRLAARPASVTERDLEDLALVRRIPGVSDAGPLVLRATNATTSGRETAGSHRPTVLDSALATRIVERHLLPRAMLWSVQRIAAHYGTGGPQRGRPDRTRWARWRWPALVAAVAAIVLACAGAVVAGRYTAAAALAAAGYAAVAAGAIAGGPRWAHPWLLRQPATAVLGSLILVTLSPRWWLSQAWWPGVALLAAAGGYLVIELRNHDVSAVIAVRRGLAVTGAGLVHAFLVSLVFLRAVAPWFAQGSDNPSAASLDGWWTAHPTVPNVGSMLWLATAWCFAAGVFSQVLSDDKPITAALGRVEWRRS
jgi:hypothetical protein